MRHASIILFILLMVGFKVQCFGQHQMKPNILFVIADDWSYGDAGIYGDKVVKTPNIDDIGREGAVFYNAFTAAPSCTPSRAAILTGKFPHELEAGASLWGYLPKKFRNYSQLLEEAGYHVGLTGKGWGPGNFQAGGYDHNPAGKSYKIFAEFMEEKPPGKPFSFWFGSQNPHRPYEPDSGERSGMNVETVDIPGWLPDVADVRKDVLDYYFEVEQFDRQLGEIIKVLKETGEYDNTLIIITSDNGMPFPRAKANLYDAGSKVPLVISMYGKIQPMKTSELVSLTDIAPTILEIAGERIPSEMTGISLWPLLRGEKDDDRKAIFIERERHANVRNAELGYPARAIRTKDFLYIHNYEPDRWPAGDPEVYHSVGPYGDVDGSPSKDYLINHRTDRGVAKYFTLAFAKRPADELYDLKSDPDQINNVAADKKYAKILSDLKGQLKDWQIETADPRANSRNVVFDQYPYFGPPVKGAPSKYKPGVPK